MKEAIVQPDLTVKIVDSQLPMPNDDQILIKVVVSGSNPKDWKIPHWSKKAANSGDDIAGIVQGCFIARFFLKLHFFLALLLFPVSAPRLLAPKILRPVIMPFLHS
ncbi:MAG: hypothetical protein LQ350_002894 [Teloschistes chrysophthalmus]|nr:MAG: hypothetical protein LQ350_002894 [Niorma chrysophthalma]